MISVADALGALNDLDDALSEVPPDEALQIVLQAVANVVPGARAGLCHDGEVPDRKALRLTVEGLGTLYVVTPRRPSAGRVALLEQIAHRAATSLRVHRMHQELRRKEDELQRLHRSALLISSRSNLQTTLDTILQMALEVTSARYGIVRLLSPQGLITGSVAGENLDRPLVEALELAPNTITGWVASNRQPLCITDLHDKPWADLYYPLDRAHEMRSELAVPLLGGGGRLEGVLNVESPRVAAFGEADRLLLQALATQAVIAIQEARLLDALQETAEHLLAWPCGRVLQRLVELARELLGGNAAMLVTPDGVRAASPDTPFEWPYRIEVPVRAEGTLGVYGDGVRPDAEWDRKVLGCLAHYAALALENESRQELLQTTREQRAVAEMFAAVGDVAANLLHQLNNKLGIIPVRVQSLQDKCASELAANPYLTKQLAEIQRSAQEAIAVMRDNLRLLRPATGASVSLLRCVEEALRTLPAGLEIHREDLENLPAIVAEESSLALVFHNLFENAMAAGCERITVRGSVGPNVVKVSVSDNGPGIAPELQERIFEFNYSGRTGKFGFGLWWVRTHMRRLGGSCSVESDGRRGTTFRLVFPT